MSVPTGLLKRAEALLRVHPELGYTNRGAFVTEAVRRWLEREEERALLLADYYGGAPDPKKRWEFPPR